jgi:hypothetical protein
MHKSATKCNETIDKWCKNKHGASKIIDTFETYHRPRARGLGALGFPLGAGGGQRGWWRPRVFLGWRPPIPSTYINPMLPWLIHPHLLLSSPWLGSHVLELCPRVRGNSTCRTPSRCWISSSSLSSSSALLDRSPDDAYTSYVCNPSEALPLWRLSSSSCTTTRP